jgi:hypothetical protein
MNGEVTLGGAGGGESGGGEGEEGGGEGEGGGEVNPQIRR